MMVRTVMFRVLFGMRAIVLMMTDAVVMFMAVGIAARSGIVDMHRYKIQYEPQNIECRMRGFASIPSAMFLLYFQVNKALSP